MSDQTEPRRGPGRPPRQQETKSRRRRRESLGLDRNLKLSVPEDAKDPSFKYRWVNDRQGRVRQLYSQDWDPVTTEQMGGGDPDPARNVSEGTTLRRAVDRTTGEHAVLMRKPKKLYDEDKAEEQKAIDEIEEAMRRGAPPSPAGLDGPNAYVPGGRNLIGRT